jgi:hypothetical protein
MTSANLNNLMNLIMQLPDEIEHKIMMYAHYMVYKPINYEFKYLLYSSYSAKYVKNNQFIRYKDIKLCDYPNWTYVLKESIYNYNIKPRLNRQGLSHKNNMKQCAKVIRGAFPSMFDKKHPKTKNVNKLN